MNSSATACRSNERSTAEPSVPVAEQCADTGRDHRRQQAQWPAKLEREAIAHNGFGLAVRIESALMAPESHAEHRRLLVKTATWRQFGDGQVVVIERQHAEQPHPAPADRGAHRYVLNGQIPGAAGHRHRHPWPKFVVDTFGVTTLAHTCAMGASMMLCRSTIMATQRYPTTRGGTGDYL